MGPLEVEFKLRLSEEQFRVLEQEVERSGPLESSELQAHYFDTPSDALAAAGLALRLRRENGRWLQTLKMVEGDANLRRVEHEVDIGSAEREAMPAVDLRRHDGTPIRHGRSRGAPSGVGAR
jgi:inorganic triphosphatase YgiF